MKNNIKIASNTWKWEHKFNWGPFKPLEPKLKDAPIAISVNHNRLLLEDISMLLKTGENMLLLIASNHEMFKKNSGNTRFLKNVLESVELDAMRPQTLRRLIYFACNLVVSSNTSQRNLLDGNCTIDEIKKLCTKKYEGGVQFKTINNHSHLFKFSDIIEQSQTLLFYSDSSIQRIQHLKKAMRNVKDISRLSGVTARVIRLGSSKSAIIIVFY